jgi:hypothetical protein
MQPKTTLESRDLILKTLTEKSTMKQNVYDNTFEVFQMLKEVLREITEDFNKDLKKSDNRIALEFRDTEKFECELKIAGDMLIFNMHTNVFEFDRNHGVWKISYVQENEMSSYSGIINVYNFLSDSFKYSRFDDLGYLIARLFVNKDNHYFVEGKRQLGFLYNNFGNETIDKISLRKIVESAILYTLNFDLLVPPYDSVKIASVAQMMERKNNSKIATGKRVGFKFRADDVSEG